MEPLANYDGGVLAPHSSFTLFGWPSQWNDTRAGVGQTHHVAFRARDRDELGAWQDRLRTLGHDVAQSQDSIRFHAPDGLLLEIITDTPVSDE